jgi:hypothetical protein
MKSSNPPVPQYSDHESADNLKSKTNPFAFTTSETSSKKFKWMPGSDGHLRVSKQEPGQYYLKCTYIVYFRSHDGYCSETEDPEEAGYELETQKLVVLYFSVPSDLTDNSGNFNAKLLDDQANLINSDETAHYFKTWSVESSCCGVCGYTDLYWPQFVEWVKVV